MAGRIKMGRPLLEVNGEDLSFFEGIAFLSNLCKEKGSLNEISE